MIYAYTRVSAQGQVLENQSYEIKEYYDYVEWCKKQIDN